MSCWVATHRCISTQMSSFTPKTAKSHLSGDYYIVNCLFRRVVSAVQSANFEIMQELHPNKAITNLVETLSALMSLLRFLCRQTRELTSLLVPSSAPHSAPCSTVESYPSTTGGRYRARKASTAVPRRALSILKWKFMFNICILLILLNWFEAAFYECKHHANVCFAGKCRLKTKKNKALKDMTIIGRRHAFCFFF